MWVVCNLLIKTSENSTISATYLCGTNLISLADRTNTSYYLYNAHGDVTGLTDPTGAVTKTYDYSAFGIEQNPDTTDTNPFRYCGEYYDTETGKYYLRARYYDPSLGRFTQADSVQYVHRELPNGASIIDPLSLNLYAYSANNPIKYCDPSGNAWDIVFDVISAGISLNDLLRDPSVANALYFAWDLGAAIVPFLPASYVAKGAKFLVRADKLVDAAKVANTAQDISKAIKITNKLDAGVDIVEFVQDGNRLVDSYSNLRKMTKGTGLEAHHLIEKRFAEALKLKEKDIISVALTKDQHQKITNAWRDAVPYGSNYKQDWKDIDKVLIVAKEVYKEAPELYAILEAWVKGRK